MAFDSVPLNPVMRLGSMESEVLPQVHVRVLDDDWSHM